MNSAEAVPTGSVIPAVDRGPFVCAAGEADFTVICRTSAPVEKLALLRRKTGDAAYSYAAEVSRPGGRDHVFKAVGLPPPAGESELRIARERDRRLLERLPAAATTPEPYLFNPGESSLSVGWKSPAECGGAVELRLAGETRSRRVPELVSGNLRVDDSHTVHLEELRPGTRYEYRVLNLDPRSGTILSGSGWHAFSTLKNGGGGGRMVFLSDIHADTETFDCFITHLKAETADFVVLAGDLCWDGVYESGGKPFYEDFLNLAISRFASRVPTVFMRGNHEWNGPYSFQWAKFFPSARGGTYGAFRAGNCCFIVLDTGPIGNFAPETPVGRYIAEQRAWLENEVMPSAMFREARFRIVLAHMPTHGIPNAPLLEKNFADLFNRGGVQLMIVGHVHRYMRIDRNGDGCRGTDYFTIWSGKQPPRTALDKTYTLVINGGGPDENGRYATALEMRSSEESLWLRVVGKDGGKVDEFRVRPDGSVENIAPAPYFSFRGDNQK